jgi:hypothetical protein
MQLHLDSRFATSWSFSARNESSAGTGRQLRIRDRTVRLFLVRDKKVRRQSSKLPQYCGARHQHDADTDDDGYERCSSTGRNHRLRLSPTLFRGS